MLLFLVQKIVHECILIIEKKDVLVLDEGPADGLDESNNNRFYKTLLIPPDQEKKIVQVCITMQVTVSVY